MPRITALALLVCAGLSPNAFAEIYQWTDANGAVHFSDTPPEQGNHQPLDMQPMVTVPMHENLQQADSVSRSRRAVGKMLESEHEDRFSSGDKSAKADSCRKLEQRLERIQAQLRDGYENDRGNRLREQRRELSRQHSRECILG
ncbi:MAG: DUF4124 domain-containing protein [Alteromonadaceae bacterium]|nr:DUF4124 domain-containing protein [Alteromonadaceae bacterium]